MREALWEGGGEGAGPARELARLDIVDLESVVGEGEH